MKKVVILCGAVFLLVVFLAGYALGYEKEISALSASIGQRIESLGKKKIAVVDFTDLQGNVTELGRFLAEELSVSLTVNFPNLEVIDRTHLKTLLQEHALSVSGLMDPSNVQKLGQISGVEAIVTGSVTPFGDNVRVTVKVIATDTAKVIAADKSDIAKTKAIEELLARGIVTETRVEVKTQEGAVPQATPQVAPQVKLEVGPQATPKPTPQPQVVDLGGVFTLEYLGGYRYKLEMIANLVLGIAFDFMVTPKRDGTLCFRRNRTRLFSLEGFEYRGYSFAIAGETGGDLCKSLIANVPVRAEILFENEQLYQLGFGKIPVLELDYSVGDDKWEVIRLYNLKEKPDRGWLGVYLAEVTPEVAERLGMGTPQGVLVADVLRDSPAQRVGLQRDDVLLKVDDKEVASLDQVIQAIEPHRPGDKVRLEVWRERQVFALEAVLE